MNKYVTINTGITHAVESEHLYWIVAMNKVFLLLLALGGILPLLEAYSSTANPRAYAKSNSCLTCRTCPPGISNQTCTSGNKCGDSPPQLQVLVVWRQSTTAPGTSSVETLHQTPEHGCWSPPSGIPSTIVANPQPLTPPSKFYNSNLTLHKTLNEPIPVC